MAYNGWKNKETWLVNLWLGDLLTAYQEDGVEITADFIRECVDIQTSYLEGFMLDMMNCALGEIDYHELAEHYKDT